MKKLIIIFLLLIPCASWAASSRVLPAAYNESTYDSAGGGEDYTSLATWEADTDTDLVTGTSGYVLTCSSGVHNDSVVLAGATTNANYFRVIRAASGARGTPTSGVRFEKSGTLADIFTINNQEAHFRCFDIAAKAVTTSSSSVTHAVSFICTVTTPSYWVGCVAYNTANTGSANSLAAGFYVGYYAGQAHYIINCAVYNINGQHAIDGGIMGTVSTAGTSNVYIYNTTINNTNSRPGITFATGINGTVLNLYVKNTIIQDWTTAAISVSGSGTENLYQTTNATSGVTFAADGYHLDSTDTGAIGDGTDLSADGVFAFDDDIDGDTRNDWDIGADEYVAPATGRRRIIMVQ